MNDTNYFAGLIKVLEKPKQKIIKNNLCVTRFRAHIPQIRNTRLVTVKFWGNLARDVATCYKENDYLLIEGYVSIRNQKNSKLKKVEIAALKVYPFLLNSQNFVKKFEN
jgi:hypothetical protein